MTTLTIYVHGVEGPGAARRARTEKRLAHQMHALGYGTGGVRTFRWSSGSPTGGALALGGLALLGGGLLGLGARAVWGLAAAGAAGGAGLAYRTGRSQARALAPTLAHTLQEAARRHERVNLVAHSLGTEVALRALERLARDGAPLPGVAICAAGTARAERDYSHAARGAREGILNVHNPLDLALLVELPLRFAPSIGRHGMRGHGVVNVRTSLGHASQVAGLRQVLAAR